MAIIADAILTQFASWFNEARNNSMIGNPDAMSLATANRAGRLSSRMVLLKHFDANGFVFFTNYHSRKGSDLLEHPHAALCLYWEKLGKQIRIEGRIVKASEQESDIYFAQRSRESQIGAWASEQSTFLASKSILEEKFLHYEKKFLGQKVPRPPHWGGFRVVPERIEFWKEGLHRLHDRSVYIRQPGGEWLHELLNP